MSRNPNCLLQISHPGGHVELPIRPGLGLQAIASKCPQLPVEFDCRKADCGICLVKVISGAEDLSPPNPSELDFLKAMRADEDERLGCQIRIFGSVHLKSEL